MADNTTDISSADLRDVARELSESRGREVIPAPEPSSNGEAKDGPLSVDEAASNLSHDRLRRLARERQELESYQRAAALTPPEMPDLDKTDADLARDEITQLRQAMEAMKEAQDNSYIRAQQQQQQAAAAQEANTNYETGRHVAGAYVDNVQAVADQQWGELQAAFPGITTPDDLQRLAAQDPEMANIFIGCFRDAQGKVALAQQQAQAAMQGYVQGFEALAAHHDAAFLEAHPDMADEEVRAAAGRGCIQMLTAAGYSEAQIREGWGMGTGVLANLRDHRVQGMLLDQWRSAEARKHLDTARDASRPMPPPVQRPGVGGSRPHAEAELRALNQALNEKQSVRAAARLLAAKRQWGR